ncbi:hypothetical protein FRC03_006032 [Tulasnella sp. 419]|nr:hypothetical protein FRC03_006032 [Tulasnella sp. 419]
MIVILDSLEGKTEEEIPDYLRQAIGILTTTFNDVLNELKVIDKRIGKRSSSSIARAILYHLDNTEKVKECSAKLEWAINEFQVTSKVDSCLKELQRGQALIQEEETRFKAEVTDGQARIHDGQTRIHDGQAKLQDGQTMIQDGQTKIQEELHEIKEVVKEKIGGNASLSLPSTVMPV